MLSRTRPLALALLASCGGPPVHPDAAPDAAPFVTDVAIADAPDHAAPAFHDAGPRATLSCTPADPSQEVPGCRCELVVRNLNNPALSTDYVIACDPRAGPSGACLCDTNHGATVTAVPMDTVESSCEVGAGGSWPGSIVCGFPLP